MPLFHVKMSRRNPNELGCLWACGDCVLRLIHDGVCGEVTMLEFPN